MTIFYSRADTLDILNVKDFGAKGDNSNDVVAFEAAMAAAVAQNKTLYFPGGTYNLSAISADTVSGVLRMVGESRESVTLVGPSNGRLVLFEPGSSCYIKGITFDTWENVLQLKPTSGIEYGTFSIEDCKFNKVVISPIHAVNVDVIRELRFNRNTCTNAGYLYQIYGGGIVVKADNVLSAFITENEIDTVGGSGIGGQKYGIYVGGITDDPKTSSIIKGNRVYNVRNSGLEDCCGILSYGRSSHITDNSINMVLSSNASNVDQEGIYTKCSYSIISNNTLINAGGREGCIVNKGGTKGVPVTTDSHGNDNIISNNTILVDDGRSIRSLGIYSQQEGTQIFNNIIEGTIQGISIVTPCKNSEIAHNKIINLSGIVGQNTVGIFADTPEDVSINNNLIKNVGNGAPATVYGINVFVPAATHISGVQITNNTIHDLNASVQNTSRALYITLDTSSSIKYCKVDGNKVSDAGRGIFMNNCHLIDTLRVTNNDVDDCTDSDITLNGALSPILSKNTIDGALQAEYSSYNVKDFGAVGNGTTDDSQAFLSAFVAAGKLEIPPGTYNLATFSGFTLTRDLIIDGRLCTIVGPDTNTNFLTVSGSGNDLTINNVNFSTWSAPVNISQGSNLGEVKLFDCRLSGSKYLVQDAGDGINSSLNSLFVHRCNINGAQRGIMYRGDVLASISICNNRILSTSITGDQTSAIWIGSNTATLSADNVEIRANYISGVISDSNDTDVHGILFYGNRAHITNNTVIDIRNGNGGANCEGIYTKQTQGSIAFNTIEDGGSAAGITLKGALRSGSAPFGHSVVIHGNHVLHRNASTASQYGITVHTEDALITSNNIEKTRGGIYVRGRGFICNDNRVIGCSGTTGTAGITHEAISDNNTPNGGSFSIKGNVITGLVATAGVTYGIYLRCPGSTNPGDIDGGIIAGNTIKGFTASSNSQAIRFETTGTGGISNVKVSDNVIDGVTRVLQCLDVTTGDINKITFQNNQLSNYTTLFQDTSDLTDFIVDIEASGVPSINASIGSLYRRLDGTIGSTFYVKESGNDSSGWIAK